MTKDQVRVSDVSEDELLTAFTPHLPRCQSAVVDVGDDCAVLAVPSQQMCVSTDVLVENHHFVTSFSTAEEIGARAAAQNLADVAAMGAVPESLVVGLVMPPQTTVEWVRGLARGFARACDDCGAGVVGGDLSAGPTLMISVTVMGQCPDGVRPVVRTGAQMGDLIIHAGTLGRSAAGLALMNAGISEASQCQGCEEEAAEALRIFRAPEPPLAMGPVMAQAGANAMMDVSDSLVRDLSRMAKASNVVMVLDESESLEPLGRPDTGGEIEASPNSDASAESGPLDADCSLRSGLTTDIAAVLPIAFFLVTHGHVPVASKPKNYSDTSLPVSAHSGLPVAPEPFTNPDEVSRRSINRTQLEAAYALARSWVLSGGEDHGLVATLSPENWEKSSLRSRGVRIIGRVESFDITGSLSEKENTRGPGVLIGEHPAHEMGWDHFTSSH
ncbi:thiamine-phosphate kinase [Actinomyces vulturis]|uniref:thiamine-phosphate kinase n=1 Tax=Actinomyces vulturis TaxID=1857645 RepID=UPI00082B0C04|nr:thiamine-phosphate kinase [Actinomyces vulturis]